MSGEDMYSYSNRVDAERAANDAAAHAWWTGGGEARADHDQGPAYDIEAYRNNRLLLDEDARQRGYPGATRTTMPPFLVRPLKAFFGAWFLGTAVAVYGTQGALALLWRLFGLVGASPPAQVTSGLLNAANAYIPLTIVILGGRWLWRGWRGPWWREMAITVVLLVVLLAPALACGFLFGSATVTEGVATVVGR